VRAWPLWDQLEADGRRADAWEVRRAKEREGDENYDKRGSVFVDDPISGYDLIPETAAEYDELQCMRLAKGDADLCERYYTERAASWVFTKYALQIAAEYHYQATDETEPGDEFYLSDDDDNGNEVIERPPVDEASAADDEEPTP
jgi:hypothetical protein